MKLHIAACSCTLFLSAVCHAQSTSVQIYGRLNVAVEDFHNSDDAKGKSSSVARLSNNRSVLGFKGDEDLGDGLKALFQIEGTVSPDTGAGGIAARDSRLGLQGKMGTLFGGNWVTPYNSATSFLDPFYPTTAGYMSIMGNGSASTADNVSDTSSFDRRQQNSLHYWSPDWDGVSVRIAHGFNEGVIVGRAKPSLTSIALIYDEGPYYLTLAQEIHHEYQGPGLKDTGTKIALAYKFGDTRVSGVAEKLKYGTLTGQLERKSYYISVTHQIDRHVIRFGIALAGDVSGESTQKIGFLKKGQGTGAVHATLGYDYNFSKRTSVFAYYTQLKNEKNGIYDLAINSLGVSPGATLKGVALGVRQFF